MAGSGIQSSALEVAGIVAHFSLPGRHLSDGGKQRYARHTVTYTHLKGGPFKGFTNSTETSISWLDLSPEPVASQSDALARSATCLPKKCEILQRSKST